MLEDDLSSQLENFLLTNESFRGITDSVCEQMGKRPTLINHEYSTVRTHRMYEICNPLMSVCNLIVNENPVIWWKNNYKQKLNNILNPLFLFQGEAGIFHILCK